MTLEPSKSHTMTLSRAVQPTPRFSDKSRDNLTDGIKIKHENSYIGFEHLDV